MAVTKIVEETFYQFDSISLNLITNLLLNNKFKISESQKNNITKLLKFHDNRYHYIYTYLDQIEFIYKKYFINKAHYHEVTDHKNHEVTLDDINNIHILNDKDFEKNNKLKNTFINLINDKNLKISDIELLNFIHECPKECFKNITDINEINKLKLKLIKYLLKRECLSINDVYSFNNYVVRYYSEDLNEKFSEMINYNKKLVTLLCTTKYLHTKLKDLFFNSINQLLRDNQSSIRKAYGRFKGIYALIKNKLFK